MNRIMVIGPGGVGKSTFSKKLCPFLQYELIHLDVLYWKAGWKRTPEAEWQNIVKEQVKKDRWIIDGNHHSTLDIRLERADTIIFFDFKRRVYLWNSIKRTLKGKFLGIKRDDIADGCPERFDSTFYGWIWNFKKRHRKEYLELLDNLKDKKNIIIFKKKKDADDFLKNCEARRSHKVEFSKDFCSPKVGLQEITQ